MNGMIERVARSIDQGVCVVCRRPAVGQFTPQDCDRSAICRWGQGTSEEQARAAIEAMRDETDEMTNAGHRAYGHAVKNPLVEGDEINAAYHAMIDAALGARARLEPAQTESLAADDIAADYPPADSEMSAT